MLVTQDEVDRAILELCSKSGGVTATQLREHLGISSSVDQKAEATKIANRVLRLTNGDVLHPVGNGKRNRLYVLNENEERDAFERRVRAMQFGKVVREPDRTPISVPENAPIRRLLERDDEPNEVKVAIAAMSEKVNQMATMLAKIHDFLFSERSDSR